MLDDLDETLKQLLVQKAGLDPAEVDISFDTPTRDWSTPVTRPTVNLYLYDIRENLQYREMFWDEEAGGNGRAKLTRRPVRIDLSYMVTVWTSATEDQHRLLWRVLETFFQYSPLPEEVLRGSVRQTLHQVRTQVAQPDGILKNVSDFWGALENQLRPAISLVVTLDLDLNQFITAPLVFARVLKYARHVTYKDRYGKLYQLKQPASAWEVAPIQLAGYVRNEEGGPIQEASVRLLGTQADGQVIQVGPTVQTRSDGSYVFNEIPPGAYTLVVEIAGRAPEQRPLTLAEPRTGEPVPELVHEVEVTMG